jgi:hypothetical protein
VPDGFDAAYAFDVIEHVDDPFRFLASLEARAGIVMVNLLEPIAGETALHRELPIRAILKHATARGLLRYRRYHGRVHLIAYRGRGGVGGGGAIDLAPPIRAAAGTAIGSIEAPTTSSVPRGRRPPKTAAVASELVTVERITSAPSSPISASPGSPSVPSM